jgi:RNA polymerase sigma-70 factor (ECF subfamily)
MTQPDNQEQREMRNREFVRLLAEHERRLAGYVHTLVPGWQDAEDVLQSTKLWLWEQFDSFQIGTDFAAWAIATANNMVRTYRKRCQRQRLCFSSDLLEKLSRHAPAMSSSVWSDRASALVECVNKLSDASRRLLHLSCIEHRKVKDIAVELGQTPSAASVALFRIRRTLFECIEERSQEKER